MNSIVPVYYQIKETVKSWIINKEFNPGDKIPSEHQLSKQFNVSRLTVRQAIAQLIQEGFLISKRGRGSFVTENKGFIDSFSLEFTGFMDDLFYQVSKTKTKSVEIRTIEAQRFLKAKLRLGEECKEIIEIKRVRFREENPFAFTVNYLPVEIGSKITERALYQKPLLQILEQDLAIEFAEAFQTIEASFADQDIAECLGISSGSPILFVERIMYTKKGQAIELVQSSYRGDLYKYVVRLKNVKRKDRNIWMHQAE